MPDSAVATDAGGPRPDAPTDAPPVRPAGRARDLAGHLFRSAWWWPTVCAALLLTWRIGRPEMWHDELVTVEVATRSTTRILRMLEKVDAVHGAYYLFMHGWVGLFGSGPSAVRLPSALAMVVATACVALTGQRLFGRLSGAAAGFVFALVPTVTRFGQETRSYALVVLAAAAATLLLLRALERPGVLRWIGYALAVAAMGLLNVVSLALLVGHGVCLVIHAWRHRRPWVLAWYALSASAGLLAALPVILRGMRQAGRQISWIPGTAPWTVWEQTFGSPAMAVAVTALAVAAVVVHGRKAPAGTATAVAVAVLPVPVILALSTGDITYFFSKYLLFLLPAWAVLAGAAIAGLRRRPLVAVALVAVAALAVPGQLAMRAEFSHGWYTYPQARPFAPLSYSEAARIIAAEHQPGDAMAPGNPWWWMHDAGVRYYLPRNVTLRDVFQERTAAERDDLFGVDCPEPARCLRGEPRIWVVLPKVTDAPLDGLPRAQSKALAASYDVVSVRHPQGMTVALLVRRG